MTSYGARPWTTAQLAAIAISNTVGALLILVALAGSARTDALEHQFGWINLALLGLILAAAADGGLLFFGRRAVGRRRAEVVPDAVEVASIRDVCTDEWVWLPGTRRGHRPGCSLIAGKRVLTVDREAIAANELVRCEVCRQDSLC